MVCGLEPGSKRWAGDKHLFRHFLGAPLRNNTDEVSLYTKNGMLELFVMKCGIISTN